MKNILNEREAEMVTQDKLVADTEDRKNALEEYIYETRGKLDDLYAPFASEEEKNKIRSIMDNAEVRSPPPYHDLFLRCLLTTFTGLVVQ
jgi:heat shock protein 4